jgi:hypothetical protein
VRGEKPTPEEMVDLECSCCGGMWASLSEGVYSMEITGTTLYKNFLGKDNIVFSEGKKTYHCPNGCQTGLFKDTRAILHDMHEVGNPTPIERFECATLLVELDKLEDKISDIKEELKSYSHVEY